MRISGVTIHAFSALVGAVVIISFAASSYALKVSTDLAEMNERRLELQCEQLNVAVGLLDSFFPGIDLRTEFQRVRSRYPDLPPCKPVNP